MEFHYCTGLNYTLLYFTAQYRAVLYCTVLYCILYCTILHCILYCTILYCLWCSVAYCTILCCTVLYTVLYCIIYCNVLYCTVLYYIVLYRYGGKRVFLWGITATALLTLLTPFLAHQSTGSAIQRFTLSSSSSHFLAHQSTGSARLEIRIVVFFLSLSSAPEHWVRSSRDLHCRLLPLTFQRTRALGPLIQRFALSSSSSHFLAHQSTGSAIQRFTLSSSSSHFLAHQSTGSARLEIRIVVFFLSLSSAPEHWVRSSRDLHCRLLPLTFQRTRALGPLIQRFALSSSSSHFLAHQSTGSAIQRFTLSSSSSHFLVHQSTGSARLEIRIVVFFLSLSSAPEHWVRSSRDLHCRLLPLTFQRTRALGPLIQRFALSSSSSHFLAHQSTGSAHLEICIVVFFLSLSSAPEHWVRSSRDSHCRLLPLTFQRTRALGPLVQRFALSSSSSHFLAHQSTGSQSSRDSHCRLLPLLLPLLTLSAIPPGVTRTSWGYLPLYTKLMVGFSVQYPREVHSYGKNLLERGCTKLVFLAIIYPF